MSAYLKTSTITAFRINILVKKLPSSTARARWIFIIATITLLRITGIAGPSGGTPEKPVGTVHLALDAADGTSGHEKIVAPGDRALVRRWTTTVALATLRSHLLAARGGGATQ